MVHIGRCGKSCYWMFIVLVSKGEVNEMLCSISAFSWDWMDAVHRPTCTCGVCLILGRVRNLVSNDRRDPRLVAVASGRLSVLYTQLLDLWEGRAWTSEYPGISLQDPVPPPGDLAATRPPPGPPGLHNIRPGVPGPPVRGVVPLPLILPLPRGVGVGPVEAPTPELSPEELRHLKPQPLNPPPERPIKESKRKKEKLDSEEKRDRKERKTERRSRSKSSRRHPRKSSKKSRSRSKRSRRDSAPSRPTVPVKEEPSPSPPAEETEEVPEEATPVERENSRGEGSGREEPRVPRPPSHSPPGHLGRGRGARPEGRRSPRRQYRLGPGPSKGKKKRERNQRYKDERDRQEDFYYRGPPRGRRFGRKYWGGEWPQKGLQDQRLWFQPQREEEGHCIGLQHNWPDFREELSGPSPTRSSLRISQQGVQWSLRAFTTKERPT